MVQWDMRQHTLELNADQRRELERTRDRDKRAYMREYASTLLKIADGQSANHIAQFGLIKARDPDTVYRWLSKYKAGGLPALVHKQRGTAGFPPQQGEALRELTRQRPDLHGFPRSRWRLQDLRDAPFVP